ncbi:glycosyltransferase family 4 protein [Natronomonas salsuginis]|uniref:Glycosyltransferase family 4 protein n=1 Tax=Natronomonas salsuginis TaxID=2217661 RepID=A0A4U5JB13_9EURY|nr:glycosyltransferase family 4 protein [Natronomonas salsuginis]TKR25461.1 glycosyltransferase family 4 protein [Natronomonas salsuginis]
MKVLQIGPLPPSVGGKTSGGVHTHVWQLSKKLVEQGHDVAVFAENIITKTSKPKIIDGVSIFGMNPESLFRSLFLDENLTNIKYLTRKFDQFSITDKLKYILYFLNAKQSTIGWNPHIVHVHHIQQRFPIARCIAEQTPLITSVHSFTSIEATDDEVSQMMYDLIRNNIYEADHLIFISEKLRNDAEIYFDCLPENSRVILNPVDVGYISSDGVAPDAYRDYDYNIMFVGDLIKRKGVYVLIDAVEQLIKQYPQMGVHIFGDGGERKQVENQIDQRGLDQIHLHGYVENISKYYSHSDLMVLPSEGESFGLVFIEAMINGIPVIGTTNVPEEVIPSNEVGYRVPPKNPQILSETIDDALSRSWDKRKIQSFAETFSWRENIDEFENIYQQSLPNLR